MLFSKRIFRLNWIMLILLMLMLGSNGYAQQRTQPVTIEARFIEITQGESEFFGVDLRILGPETTQVDAVNLDIGDGWDANARAVTLPNGWSLDTTTRGIFKFEGPEVSLPLQIEILSSVQTQDFISSAKLLHARNTLVEVNNIPILPMELPDVPAVKIFPHLPDTSSFLSRQLKKVSLKLFGGPGFFLNGAGDLEKLRIETMDYITAMGEPLNSSSELKRQGLDITEVVPSYESEFNWEPLKTNTHIQFGVNFDITDDFSIGISSGFFGAKNDDIQYSHGVQSIQIEEWGTTTETDTTVYIEDFSLGAVPLFANISYSSNPNNSLGGFTPEFSFSFGPIFAQIERNFSEERNYNVDFTSPYYANGWDHEWSKTNINGNWRASTLGAQISGGIDYNVTPWMTIGIDSFLFLANFKNWKGSEEGDWEWGLQNSNDELGGIYQDESDSGSWNSGPDAPLLYYNIDNQPFMFIGETAPDNGLPPSINWNTWGIQVTIKIGLGENPGTGERTDDDPGDDPKDTPPPTMYGEEIENDENVWNAYVFIGSISGPASFYEAAIINAADEAQSDFEKAGYNVIINHSASYRDFRTVIDDPQARAFWFAGHGTEDEDGPLPMIRGAGGEGITPSEEYYPMEAAVLFRKENLNQVTMHACKQDLPEWRNAFPGATYDSWSISPIGPMMYWWQLGATYPEIDQATGREK